jgi:leucyl aminopeptidase (aminopeptidase T)
MDKHGGYTDDILNGCRILVSVCADLKPDESVLIVSDHGTSEIGWAIAQIAQEISSKVDHYSILPFDCHGEEPPKYIADAMIGSDVVFGITQMSMAHSKARYDACQGGMRYLSLPDYSFEILKGAALKADFRSLTALSNHLARQLTEGSKITIKTELGTSLECNIVGRTANAAPGWCNDLGTLASPPNAETNIAVVENGSNGIIIIDGSIPCPEFGLLKNPIQLFIKNGQVEKIKGKKSDVLDDIFDRINSPFARCVAEFGIGLNPLARLCGAMLEDEGCLGTIHLGIGSNVTIGGRNSVSFHLDFVVRSATVTIDNKVVIKNGLIKDK